MAKMALSSKPAMSPICLVFCVKRLLLRRDALRWVAEVWQSSIAGASRKMLQGSAPHWLYRYAARRQSRIILPKHILDLDGRRIANAALTLPERPAGI